MNPAIAHFVTQTLPGQIKRKATSPCAGPRYPSPSAAPSNLGAVTCPLGSGFHPADTQA